ncbi:TIGR01777 family oxidoreductase [Desulfatitalea tepidiphila]|uniref:TIGR01777 family oxidoreductase n=1 Tax=Desulfatitalea tepidiphila TaxID=1185843 RepID=UPI0006B5992C|nr:TIGR01777 family oxidoreductase [Desulfatitalea tepidiphila]
MQTLITGGTGFVGRSLCAHLMNQGHRVTVIGTRRRSDAEIGSDPYTYIAADTTQPGDWQQAVAQSDLIVNLTGRTIFKRWTRRYKEQIYDSRILTTRHLVSALPEKSRAILLSTSAVGYYGDGEERILTEQSPNGEGFLASLARDWEAEARKAADRGVRVALMRLGIVLGTDGGALANMLPAFRKFAGGPLGSGRQWFPWIHIGDLIAAMQFLIERSDLSGAFNLCGPEPVRNRDFAKALGKAIGRPAAVPVPLLALKLALGEAAGALLAGQRAVPAALQAAGFEFRYGRLDAALEDLLKPI